MRVGVDERRKFPRNPYPSRLRIRLLHPPAVVVSEGINISEAGLCIRLQEALEIRSLVRFQLIPPSASFGRSVGRRSQSMDCQGRVAWVIQRLDLRTRPPFLFDTGIALVDPSPMIRQLVVQTSGVLLKRQRSGSVSKDLEPVVIRERRYLPHLERDAKAAGPWHLVVIVDGSPCFSGHYSSRQAAMTAWLRFRRQQSGRSSRIASHR